MLTKRYMASLKNLPTIMQRIIDGTAPDKFTVEHLKGLGFTNTNDRGIIPLLKDLGFLSQDGAPTQRYHAYRDSSQSREVMGEALHQVYEELFHINANPSQKDKDVIVGRFKSTHNVSDRVAEQQAATFFALLKLADLKPPSVKKPPVVTQPKKPIKEVPEPPVERSEAAIPASLGLRYNIEIHLPATKDVEVYNAIFKSLKEHLID